MFCSRCGADNPPDSKFCKNCGMPVVDEQASSYPNPPAQSKDNAQGIAESGKRFGHEMSRMGEKLGMDIANWWDTTLGILSPIILGAFGIFFVLFGLFVTEIVASRTDDPQFWEELGDFIMAYFLLLAGLMFLGAFHSYFYRRYRPTYRWIGPLVTAALVTVWAWSLAQVLMIAGRHSAHSEFGDAGEILDSLLTAVFILGVIVGYAILWFSLVSPANWDKPEPKN